jgi:hypothetical protein
MNNSFLPFNINKQEDFLVTSHQEANIISNNVSIGIKSSHDITFVYNNFIRDGVQNQYLYQLQQAGGSFHMTPTGYEIKLSQDSLLVEVTKSQAKDILSNFFNKVDFKFGSSKDSDIKISELKLVMGKTFDPYVKSEYYQKDGVVYYNTFRPTSYMELDRNLFFKETPAIFALLSHLFVEKVFFNYFINWLAYQFVGLKKPTVAIVIRGRQGAGKGILWDKIIKPLFGLSQCFQLNDKSVRGNFLADALEGRLFINLDEISHGNSDNKELKNFLKGIITNLTGSHEKKHKNLSTEINLYAAILITTNEPQSLSVEHSDRRFTIKESGGNIAHENFLGYGCIENLLNTIESELEDFALYLHNYPIDAKQACTALDTPEKRALVGITNDRFINYNAPFFQDQ